MSAFQRAYNHAGTNRTQFVTSLQSWFNSEFNKFLDVADKIDRAITGCTTADDDIADDDGDYSPAIEEEGDEDVTSHDRYRGRSSRHRHGRSRTRRRLLHRHHDRHN